MSWAGEPCRVLEGTPGSLFSSVAAQPAGTTTAGCGEWRIDRPAFRKAGRHMQRPQQQLSVGSIPERSPTYARPQPMERLVPEAVHHRSASTGGSGAFAPRPWRRPREGSWPGLRASSSSEGAVASSTAAKGAATGEGLTLSRPGRSSPKQKPVSHRPPVWEGGTPPLGDT